MSAPVIVATRLHRGGTNSARGAAKFVADALAVTDWDKMLEAVTFDLWLDLDDSTGEEVRRRLATTSSLYRAVRKATAQPRSAVGKRLANALRDAEESGVMGELMWGHWADTT